MPASVYVLERGTLCYVDECGSWRETDLQLSEESQDDVLDAELQPDGSYSVPVEVVDPPPLAVLRLEPRFVRVGCPVVFHLELRPARARYPTRRRDWEDRQYHRPKRRRR